MEFFGTIEFKFGQSKQKIGLFSGHFIYFVDIIHVNLVNLNDN